jgi:hypothetical protein
VQLYLLFVLSNKHAEVSQDRRQPPQLFTSVEKFRQALPHKFSPPVQDLEHVELLQIAEPVPARMEQTLLQPPQLLLSLVRSAHEFPHPVNPALQLAAVQAPLEQAAVPLGIAAQALPQLPQLFRLVWRLVSHPLAGFWSQSPKPGLQAPSMQAPALQVADALFMQFVLHEPQFAGSMEMFSHSPLQEVCPAGQASASPVFCVRYSMTTLVLAGALPVEQVAPVRRLARKLVPAGNVSIALPESTSVWLPVR